MLLCSLFCDLLHLEHVQEGWLSPVEEVRQTYEAAARHSGAQELTHGCGPVHVNLQSLKWMDKHSLALKLKQYSWKLTEVPKGTSGSTWMTERARLDWYSSMCRVWAHLLSSSSKT